MKSPLRQPAFLLSLGLYAVLIALKKTGVYLPLVSDYAADLLAMPVVLSIGLWAVRKATARPDYRLSAFLICFTVVLYSLLFELWFPRISGRFTADPWDVLAYAAGAAAFYFWMQPPKPAA